MSPYFKDQTLASLYAEFMRAEFPKRYARQGYRRAEQAYREQLRAAPQDKREEIKGHLTWELWEWIDWVREIEDAELVAKAVKWTST